MTRDDLKIREVTALEELRACVALQKKVFGLPDLEISPVRHLIVTKSAGGFTLGAFVGEKLAGFVLSVPMFAGEHRAFYSHMMAVDPEFQNYGVGAHLKWAQREKALAENVKIVCWTFQPVQARNAYLNLEKLGVEIHRYQPNYYGTDYYTAHEPGASRGLDSDRLFAVWDLESEKVAALSKGEKFTFKDAAVRRIEIPNDWDKLVKTDLQKAIAEQTRIKGEFEESFAENLICKSFERSETHPQYLLYRK